ncbi:unnamed protein product [Nesidiocoris tenuis]|uniref:Uncharacterized protein n=1 Tax=Nesidiocoris tenuis TaxID=355587 RepID=A0A6H5HFI6_9HEMI|nr:unnamed protein product [Nesidiocoris tenuis]
MRKTRNPISKFGGADSLIWKMCIFAELMQITILTPLDAIPRITWRSQRNITTTRILVTVCGMRRGDGLTCDTGLSEFSTGTRIRRGSQSGRDGPRGASNRHPPQPPLSRSHCRLQLNPIPNVIQLPQPPLPSQPWLPGLGYLDRLPRALTINDPIRKKIPRATQKVHCLKAKIEVASQKPDSLVQVDHKNGFAGESDHSCTGPTNWSKLGYLFSTVPLVNPTIVITRGLQSLHRESENLINIIIVILFYWESTVAERSKKLSVFGPQLRTRVLSHKWKYWTRPKIENLNGASGKAFITYILLLEITSRTSVRLWSLNEFLSI